jgi:hypothetical protein
MKQNQNNITSCMEQEDYSKLHHVSSKAFFFINQIVEQKSGWQDGKNKKMGA